MVSNKITEGVGKKIVEALKQQSDIEIRNVVENPTPVQESSVENNEVEYTTSYEEPVYEQPIEDETNSMQNEDFTNTQSINSSVDAMSTENDATSDVLHSFSNPHVMPFSQPSPISQIGEKDSFASELDGFEIPTNIAVLKQLINQLPAGVSKQTGAQIIKQTMEALGISMKSVLQEAQQVQESLNSSARECQTSIMEYKKQIGVLEKQAQKFQRQYAALNDIISLFIQTNI